jgi:hypothetical protein
MFLIFIFTDGVTPYFSECQEELRAGLVAPFDYVIDRKVRITMELLNPSSTLQHPRQGCY